MYPLPDDFDPPVFASRELQRVCFIPYSVELTFASDLSIRVFSQIVHDGIDAETRWSESSGAPIRRSTLMRLVELKVERATVQPRATLVLNFENSHTLRIVEDDTPYECYHVHIGEREIIV
jgi:hypothetical protein